MIIAPTRAIEFQIDFCASAILRISVTTHFNDQFIRFAPHARTYGYHHPPSTRPEESWKDQEVVQPEQRR